MSEIKKEQWRIWEELCKILPIDDYGNLLQGDEVHKIVFQTNSPVKIKSNLDFNKAVEPAIRYLLQNHNPYTKIYIDYENAELLEGVKSYNLKNEVPD